MLKGNNKKLLAEQIDDLQKILKVRFEKNTSRQKGIEWAKVQLRLETHSEKLWSLNEIERTVGEPDVVGLDQATGEFIFIDCSPKSPAGRRSLCYDPEALASRKANKPKHSVLGMAKEMVIELLKDEEYRCDLKNSSIYNDCKRQTLSHHLVKRNG